MAKNKTVARKPKKQSSSRSRGKESGASRQADSNQSAVEHLQQRAGNRAVGRLLAQRKGQEAASSGASKQEAQGQEQEKASKTRVEAGKVKVERPVIEYYDVGGSSLAEAARQLLKDGKWYEHEYKYVPKVVDGVVTRVDIIVTITLRLPRWTGQGWLEASPADKITWLTMLAQEQMAPETFEEVIRLPGHWLGVDWKKAPDPLKGEWREMLQAMQKQEQGHVDVILRRALVLQQRMLKQPEKQVKAIFALFEQNLKVEREVYDRQTTFGQKSKISLGSNAMLF